MKLDWESVTDAEDPVMRTAASLQLHKGRESDKRVEESAELNASGGLARVEDGVQVKVVLVMVEVPWMRNTDEVEAAEAASVKVESVTVRVQYAGMLHMAGSVDEEEEMSVIVQLVRVSEGAISVE